MNCNMAKIPEHIEYWFKSEKIIRSISSITEDMMKYYDKKKIDHHYQRVLFLLLQRLHLNYATANKIMGQEYLNISKFRFSIFSLLRPLLSDFIIQTYLIESLRFESTTLKPFQDDFIKRYKEISNNYYQRLDSLLASQIKEGKVTEADRNDYFQKLRKDNPEHFEADRAKVKKMRQLQPKTLVDEIKKGSFRDLADVYQFYFILSQYDHFTEQTEELMDTDFELDYKLIFQCSNYLVSGIIMNNSMMDLNMPFKDKLLDLKENLGK